LAHRHLLVIAHSFSSQFGVQTNPRAGDFVSRDKGFDQQGIEDLSRTQGVQLILYEDLEPLRQVLANELSGTIKKAWDKDRQRAIEAARGNMKLLQDFTRKNLEIPERLGRLEVVRVTNVEAVDVLEARTPFPLGRKEGEPVTLSVDVKIRLHGPSKKKRDPSYCGLNHASSKWVKSSPLHIPFSSLL
jgi:hypothetical protein